MSEHNQRTSITPRNSRNDLIERFAYQGDSEESSSPTRHRSLHLLHALRTSLAVRLALVAGLMICICMAVILWLFLRNPVHIPQLDDAIRGDAPQFSVSVEQSGYRSYSVFDNKNAHVTLYMNEKYPPETGLTQRLQEQFSLSGLLAATVTRESAFSIFDHLDQGSPVLVVGDVSSSMFEKVTWVTLTPEAFTPLVASSSTDEKTGSTKEESPTPSAPVRDTSLLRFANYYAKVPSSKVMDHLDDLTKQQNILDGEKLERYRASASTSAHKELLSNNRIALYKGTTQTGVYWALVLEYQDDGMARVCLLEANHPALLAWLIDHKGLL